MKYKIAIPSYKRPETIKAKTLRVLDAYNINPKLVSVFVANEEEEKDYRNALAGHKYGGSIVVGVPTIGAQRNFIEKHYEEGTRLMMFDDDIEAVQRKDGSRLVPVNDLEGELIFRGFAECEKVNAKTFGIYAASNPFFMSHRNYHKLCYIIGSTFGVICERDKFLERVTNHGEDYEYSIRQYLKNGVLVRLDDITVKSNYYKEEGGLQEVRTRKYVYDSIKKIADKFPDHCTMYIRKTTGNAELRLRDKTKNSGTIKVGSGDDVQSIIEAMKKSNTERENNPYNDSVDEEN